MQVNIRKAVLDDAPALASILTEAMHRKLSLGDPAWGDQPYTTEELEERLVAGHTYTVELNEKAVATFMLVWEDETTWGQQPPVAGYIHQLATGDSIRGLGIGAQILDWASQKAAERGRKFLRLDFQPDNTGLKSYYEKLGFKWVKDREVRAPGKVYIAALYERPVN